MANAPTNKTKNNPQSNAKSGANSSAKNGASGTAQSVASATLSAADLAQITDVNLRLKITAMVALLQFKTAVNEKLTLELARLKRWQFGRKTEAWHALGGLQQLLLPEALAEDESALALEIEALSTPVAQPDGVAVADADGADSAAATPINAAQHALSTQALALAALKKPKGHGRAPLPAHLPRVIIRHDVADDAGSDNNTTKACNCKRCGTGLVKIGESITEELDIKPLEFFVNQHIRSKYACRCCDTVQAAPMPARIVDGGIPAPGLIAQILVAKYSDHLPLYRQESIYARAGVGLSRQTMGDWVGAAGAALAPLVAAMRKDLLLQDVIHADETTVKLLNWRRPKKGDKERDKTKHRDGTTGMTGKTATSYFWVYRSASLDKVVQKSPVVIFDYQTSREGLHPAAFLADYQGTLMVDGYSGYSALFANGMTALYCWAHVRRKFVDLHVANKSTVVAQALAQIAALYAVEAFIRDKKLDPDTTKVYRQKHAVPILNDLKRWFDATRGRALDNSGLAHAIDYALARWPGLVRYTEDGHFPIDNNPVENALRPIALGRKNWLFLGSPRGGERAACIMSLIATAKANGHDPYAYLKDVLTRLPTHPNRKIYELLPHQWKPASTASA